jgi:hypothetical protein
MRRIAMQQYATARTERGFKRNALPLPPGNCFVRQITAKAVSQLTGETSHEVATRMWPSDRVVAEILERAASAPAMTTVAGWAAELVHKIVTDTLATMGAASAAVDVIKQSLVLEWNGAGALSVPGFVASVNNSSFVQEGQPIPVRQLSSTGALLQPYKLATIAVLSREMAESSNAEALIGDALVRSSGLALDAVFFGSAAATAAQPAGIRNGIATSTASANTDAFGAFFEDMATLVNAISQVGGKGPYIVVASAGRVVSASGRFPGKGDAEAVILPVASAAVGNDIIAIAPQAVAVAIGADPDVEMVRAGTLVMDTAPVTPNTTQTTKSMWQTDSYALKVRWPVSWTLRDSRAVAWLTPIWK